jgi:hypothetical protein
MGDIKKISNTVLIIIFVRCKIKTKNVTGFGIIGRVARDEYCVERNIASE